MNAGDRIVGRLTGRWRQLQDSARSTRAAVARPKPPVTVELGRTVRAWWLQLVIAALGVTVILVLHPGVVAVVVICLVLAWITVRPGAAGGAIFCAALGVVWLVDPSPALSAQEFGLLALGPAVWTLAGVLTALGWRTRIELAALRPTALRWLVVQLISQPLLAGAELLRADRPAQPTVPAAVIAFGCAAGIAVAAWLILPRLSHPDH